MIFRKSLSKKKGAAYSFVSGISASFVPAVLLTLFLLLILAVLPAIEFINRDYQFNKSGAGALSRDTYKFLTFASSDFHDMALVYMALAAMGILSILIAVRIFSFICDKKTVNVYYSLGIKRSTLFLSKYASGALLLCAASGVAVIFSYIVNLIYLGASWQLSLVLLHYYCGISVFLLVCYSITAMVFASVGTVSEAVVYSVALLFAPTIIIFITEQIIGTFLPSSTFNMYLNHFADNHYDYSYSSDSLLETTASYNPVLFFAEDLLKYACGKKEAAGLALPTVDTGWEFPNLFIHAIWFAVAVTAAFGGSLLFRRIKAENCGFLNTNKVLSNLTIFELCLFGSCLFLSEIRWNGYAIPLALGAAAALALYIIAEIFLKRNLLRILKALYKFVIHMAVIAIIFTVCATGAFGFADYIPDASKVASAEIAIPFSYAEFSTQRLDYGWNSSGFKRVNEPYRLTFMPVMTAAEDIEAVQKINRDAVRYEGDDGFSCDIVIRYNLKNGSVSERKHTLTTEEELRSLFALRGTKAYGAQLQQLFYEENRIENIKKEAESYPYYVDDGRLESLCFDYDYSKVSARSSDLHTTKTLELTKEQFNILKDAVYKDIMNTTSGEYYESTKAQTGVLSFEVTEKAYRIDGVNGYDSRFDEPADMIIYEEDMTSVVVPEPVPITPGEDIGSDELNENPEDITEEMPEEPSPYSDEYFKPYNGLGKFDHESCAYDFIITENMTNTLNALASFGMSDCFSSELTIESVSFAEFDTAELFYYYSDYSYVLDFFAYTTGVNEYYEYELDKGYKIEGNESENIITDKDKINELSSLMKLHEYSFNKGYYCLVKYTDGFYTVKFLSQDDAPEYVRNYNYTEDLTG